MKCENCDHRDDLVGNFCPDCGYQTMTELKLCPTCKLLVCADWLFCIHCGTSLRQVKIIERSF